MKRIIFASALLLAAQFLLPILLLRPVTAQEEPADLPPLHRSGPLSDEARDVRLLLSDGTVEKRTLGDYLWGVVAAEMPASFRPEALKAQAVAARTYWASSGSKHENADVCTDSGCCQAWVSRQEALAGWGERGEEYAGRITRAVGETDGLCVLYEGRPIRALFFSSAPGSTVDAQAVWGTAAPYLVSVESPEGDEVPNYHSRLTLTAKEVRELIGGRHPDADLSGAPGEWFSDFAREPSGTVNTVRVGGVTLKGGEVRSLLGLRSACFTVTAAGDQLTFDVTGYGHGVGMSQYGANAMAAEGKDFREILTWYYTGTEVAPYP